MGFEKNSGVPRKPESRNPGIAITIPFHAWDSKRSAIPVLLNFLCSDYCREFIHVPKLGDFPQNPGVLGFKKQQNSQKTEFLNPIIAITILCHARVSKRSATPVLFSYLCADYCREYYSCQVIIS